MIKKTLKDKLKLKDVIKLEESTIQLFNEVTSEKRIIKEVISEENTIYACCIPNDPYDYLDINCENGCDFYTKK